MQEEDVPSGHVDEPAISPTGERETETDLRDLREVALEDYAVESVTDIDEQGTSIGERISFWWDNLAIGYKATIAALVTLNIILFLVAIFIVVRPLPAQTPRQPTITPLAGVPVPAEIWLPGGWPFLLDRGTVVDGQWTPQRAEWLEGSEIRRFIALPWSEQLELVIRSFEVGEEIEIVLNNGDSVFYKVILVEEVPRDMVDVASMNEQSLTIVLFNPESDTRWIVIAVP